MMNLREKYSTIEIAMGTCLFHILGVNTFLLQILSLSDPKKVTPGPGWDQNESERKIGLHHTGNRHV